MSRAEFWFCVVVLAAVGFVAGITAYYDDKLTKQVIDQSHRHGQKGGGTAP